MLMIRCVGSIIMSNIIELVLKL